MERTRQTKLPLALKVLFTTFTAAFVPSYWYLYGPTNFLYFCNVGLFLTLIGIWTEKPLPISMAAVGVTLPSIVWIADFFLQLFGSHLIGMTNYMFDEMNPLIIRSLALFHFWLPLLLIWLVIRLGYDSRAVAAWIATAWILIIICYLWMPASAADTTEPYTPYNINYAYGLRGKQTTMPEIAWLIVVMLLQPIAAVAPMHWFFKRFARPA